MTAFRIFLLFVAVLFGVSSAMAKDFAHAATQADVEKPAGTLLAYEPIKLPALFKGRAWRILYATRDFLDRPILSSGIVVLSGYANNDPRKRPIVAWAHPTTGIARKCAPSLSHAPVNTILGMKDFVGAGYILAATDYPGLGTIGPVGYMVGKGQANAVVDSVRAARQIPGVGGGNEFALFGYSQGAHAAIFASLFASSYAPELKLLGVAAVAPPTRLESLLTRDLQRMEGRVLVSFIINSWLKKYGLSAEGLVDSETSAQIDKIANECVNNLVDKLTILSAQKPLKTHFLLQSPMSIASWHAAIAGNSISSLSAAVPSIVFQGASDSIVDPAVTLQVVRASCRNGARVQFVTLPGVGHGGAAKASVADAVKWITDRFNARPAPSNCR